MKQLIFITLISVMIFSGNMNAQKIIIGMNVWPGCGLLFLAEKKGFFKEAGLTVEFKMYSDYNESIQAFKSGKVDAIQEDLFSTICTAIDGVDFVAVMPTVDNIGFDEFISLKQYKTISDLKNKPIGFCKGGIGHFLVLKALQQAGMSEKDIIPVEANFLDVFEKLNKNDIAAGVSHFYHRYDGNVIYSTKNFPVQDFFLVKQETYNNQTWDIEKIIQIWQKSLKYYQNNEEEALKIMADAMHLDNNKFIISLMNRAPLLDMELVAEKYYCDNGTARGSISELLEFMKRYVYTDPQKNIRISEVESNIKLIFNNELLKKAGYIKPSFDSTLLTRTGKDYALLFATDKYDDVKWPKLSNPVKDARDIEHELKVKYGFTTCLVTNPTIDTISHYLKMYSVKKYNAEDQLMVYFAGHGFFDNIEKEGYIVARNSVAGEISNSSYYPYSKLLSQLDKIECRHIFLMVDVCFSGTLFKEIALSRGTTLLETSASNNYNNIKFIKEYNTPQI